VATRPLLHTSQRLVSHRRGKAGAALTITGTVVERYEKRGREYAVVDAVVALPDGAVRLLALLGLGADESAQDDLVSAKRHVEEAARLASNIADARLSAIAAATLGALALHDRDYPRARALFERSLVDVRGEDFATVVNLGNLALTALRLGDIDEAGARIRENLELGSYRRAARRRRTESLATVLELFPILRERERQLAGSLSGGEQQMLALGRGLMAQPELLLLDEPSQGLGPRIVEQIFETIDRIRRERRLTVLLVEQRVVEALELCDRGYVLETGRVVLAGDRDALLADPRVQRAYLGG